MVPVPKPFNIKSYLKRGSKFGNTPKFFNGRLYHSIKEANYAATLELLKKAGEIKDYTPQYTISLDVNGEHINDVIVDFLVMGKYGRKELHEVKGYPTLAWRRSWKLLKAIYGKEYKYEVV